MPLFLHLSLFSIKEPFDEIEWNLYTFEAQYNGMWDQAIGHFPTNLCQWVSSIITNNHQSLENQMWSIQFSLYGRSFSFSFHSKSLLIVLILKISDSLPIRKYLPRTSGLDNLTWYQEEKSRNERKLELQFWRKKTQPFR